MSSPPDRSADLLEAVATSAELLVREPFSAELADRVLAHLGRATAVSRTYLFRHRRDEAGDSVADLVAEWVDSGVAPQRENPAMQGFSYRESGNDWLHARLAAGEVVAERSDRLPAAFQPVLASQEILSIALTPLRVGGGLWGVLGFDECRQAREWSDAEIGVLRVAAGLVAAAIERADVERERRASDERARRAERMEALGWLAGGLARDFDVLMTTIRGYGERVQSRLHPGDPLRGDVSEMLLAAERAAEMTRDLASLGRRQPARPVRFDLATWIDGRLPLLRRLVGDQIAIGVETTPLGGPLEADPELLEQALVTFVLDARDRLAPGGRIELRCAPLGEEALRRRGALETLGSRAARLLVRDDGPPLAEEAATRRFEPFIDGGPASTRGGLGLAAAYGIVRQCGGLVQLESGGADGTSYELLLPLASGESAVPSTAERDAELSADRAATVLLVEDEDLIRNLAEQILLEAGHRVLTAANASEAMALAEQASEAIDLLLTDVVMPGASGADLAHRLLRRHPEMRILYMSGYSDSLVFRYGVLQERAAFLRKPFSAEVLERRVAELLSGEATG